MSDINKVKDYINSKEKINYDPKNNDLYKTLESLPARKDENGCTMCALTARLNGRLFGVVLPMGNAFAALEHPGVTCTGTLPKGKENELPDSTWTPITYKEFIKAGKDSDISDMAVSEISEDLNLMNNDLGIQLIADIAVDSDSENGELFGHRVLAYKVSGKWFVLDPYVEGNKGKGIKLSEYMKTHNILKCNFYESSGYNFQRYEEQVANGAQELKDRGKDQQHTLNTYIDQQDDRKTLLLLCKMNNGEPLDTDDRLQLIDDNESDALANGILNNTAKSNQHNVLNMLFDWFRVSGKRKNKKPVFINMYRILCTVNKDFYNEEINNTIIKYVLETSDLKYLDIDTYYWLYKSFKNNFDEKTRKKLENKYIKNVSLDKEINGKKLYIKEYHKYFFSLYKK